METERVDREEELDHEYLLSCTLKELKSILMANGWSIYGTKNQLIQRIEQYQEKEKEKQKRRLLSQQKQQQPEPEQEEEEDPNNNNKNEIISTSWYFCYLLIYILSTVERCLP